MEEYKGPNPYKGILDFEVLNQREDYIEKVLIPGTIEHRLNEEYKHMTLCEFLNYTSIKENKNE